MFPKDIQHAFGFIDVIGSGNVPVGILIRPIPPDGHLDSRVFPEAAEVKKVNDYWYYIQDSKGKVLGYALNSNTHCEGIIGYGKQTPVMIITNKSGVIQKVALLTHSETLSYIKLLENNGFFNLWNGKKLKEAQKVELDGYSGATVTAIAVQKNVKYMLEKGSQIKPTSR